MLENFASFLLSAYMFSKIKFPKKLFHEYYQSAINLDPDPLPSSGSILIAKVISRQHLQKKI